MDPFRNSSEKRYPREGRYANHFAVGYNAFEIIFDFGQSYSENDQAELHTRIVTNPAYAKTFLNILKESISEYEQTYETIKER